MTLSLWLHFWTKTWFSCDFLKRQVIPRYLLTTWELFAQFFWKFAPGFITKWPMRYRLLSRGYSMNSHFLANFTIFDEKNIFWFCFIINPLSANPTQCSNTLKQFFGNSVFNHFVGLALKAIIPFLNLIYKSFIGINEWLCFNFWHK